jgi:hypothetical protein
MRLCKSGFALGAAHWDPAKEEGLLLAIRVFSDPLERRSILNDRPRESFEATDVWDLSPSAPVHTETFPSVGYF